MIDISTIHFKTLSRMPRIFYFIIFGFIIININANNNDVLYSSYVNQIDITLHLYHSLNQSDGIDIKNPQNISYIDIDLNKNIKIIIHGWRDDPGKKWIEKLRDKYLKFYDCNIVVAGWEALSTNINYLAVVKKIKPIGEEMAKLILKFTLNNNVDVKNIHILGHSLGSHIAGSIGAFFINEKIGKIGRITGLDPAGPGFENNNDLSLQLDPSDAEFVDAIHTCIDYTGISKKVGHVDIYPNGGGCRQPGCFNINKLYCGHLRVLDLYSDSFEYPTSMLATKCDSWKEYKKQKCKNGKKIYVGHDISTKSKGVYYLKTNRKSPYGQNQF